MLTISYGSIAEQVGDYYQPVAPDAPLVCLLHGGFWRMPYGRDQLYPLAAALHQHGFAVWNIGYRRVGAGGAPWPATLDDVRAAMASLPGLQRHNPTLALRRVVLAGHSAGGQLAFWAASQAQELGLPCGLAGVIGLAPLLDLEAAWRDDLGHGAVAEFIAGSPATAPDRYAAASPAARLPINVPQLILHGARDTDVPPAMSRSWVAAARHAGDSVEYHELPGLGHMDLIDPGSTAFPMIEQFVSTAER